MGIPKTNNRVGKNKKLFFMKKMILLFSIVLISLCCFANSSLNDCEFEISTTNSECGLCDGTATITTDLSGIPDLYVIWFNITTSGFFGENLLTVTDLCAGQEFVAIVSSNGTPCDATVFFELECPIEIQFIVEEPQCGATDGLISIQYDFADVCSTESFLWYYLDDMNAQVVVSQDEFASGLAPNETYFFEMQYNASCTYEGQVDMGVICSDASAFEIITTVDCGLSEGTAYLNVLDDTNVCSVEQLIIIDPITNYFYGVIWGDGPTNLITNLPSGVSLEAIVYYNESCVLNIPFTVESGCDYYDFVWDVQDPFCNANNGSISLEPNDFTNYCTNLEFAWYQANPGGNPYWVFISDDDQLTNVGAGDYYLTLNNSEPCFNDFFFTLEQSSVLCPVTVIIDTEDDCGQGIGVASAIVDDTTNPDCTISTNVWRLGGPQGPVVSTTLIATGLIGGEIYTLTTSNGTCAASFGFIMPDLDTDGDGVCDGDDLCPNLNDNLIGQSCNDFNPCTINDTWNTNCQCQGVLGPDSDGDGTPDNCDLCPGGLEPGTPCNDGNVCTENDKIQEDCSCQGEFIDGCECPNGEPGTECDDGNMCTENDKIQEDCSCQGELIEGCECPFGEPGSSCDDGNVCTTNDKVQEDCSCLGEWIEGCSPCEPGSPCDDGDECTENDKIQEDCSCQGELIEGCGPCETIDFNDVESGWGIWSDGGSDAARVNDSSYANSGNFSFRLRDNTNSSTITTSSMDFSNYSYITVDFTYITESMDNNNEDFWLQFTDGSSGYQTVEEWNLNDEFVNGVREFDQVTIPGPFTTGSRLRFRCDASGNWDWVYLDDILITGCYEEGGMITGEVITEAMITDQSDKEEETVEKRISNPSELISIYPNPATRSSNLIIETIDVDMIEDVQLFSLDGRKHLTEKNLLSNKQIEINTNKLEPGTYVLRILTIEGVVSKQVLLLE